MTGQNLWRDGILFICPPSDWGETCVLTGGEAKHLINVLRMKPGQVVRLFDGEGSTGLFEITGIDKKRASLRSQSPWDKIDDSTGLCLAVAWNKSSRRSMLLEKAVELGADRILFWQAEFTQGKLPDQAKENWQDKLIQAAKQCGRAMLPQVEIVSHGLDGLLALSKEFDRSYVLWESEQPENLLAESDFPLHSKTLVLIGPEGGFHANEIKAVKSAGIAPKSLGTSILRWETAAMVCMSTAYMAWQRTNPGAS